MVASPRPNIIDMKTTPILVFNNLLKLIMYVYVPYNNTLYYIFTTEKYDYDYVCGAIFRGFFGQVARCCLIAKQVPVASLY
jgi:hypothetical protein